MRFHGSLLLAVLVGGGCLQNLSCSNQARVSLLRRKALGLNSTVLWSPQHEADLLRSPSADRFLPL